jgi:hypothetical protein
MYHTIARSDVTHITRRHCCYQTFAAQQAASSNCTATDISLEPAAAADAFALPSAWLLPTAVLRSCCCRPCFPVKAAATAAAFATGSLYLRLLQHGQ